MTATKRIRVGVFGAGGRMGVTVCQAVANDSELELVAAVDPFHAGLDIGQVAKIESLDIQVSSSAEALVRNLPGALRAGVENRHDLIRGQAAVEHVVFECRREFGFANVGPQVAHDGDHRDE